MATGSAEVIVSSDTHIVEPPDLFVKRLDEQYRDKAPRVVERDGVETWEVTGKPGLPPWIPARAGDRFLSPEERPDRWSPTTWEGCSFMNDVGVSTYEPQQWLEENRRDGVHGGVVFPSHALLLYALVEETPLLNAICRVMNDWMLEFADADPDRIRPMAMINLDDIEAAIGEMQRTKTAGASGGIIPVRNPRPYDDPEFDRFWAAAVDLDLPLAFHVATPRWPETWSYVFTHGGMVNGPDLQVRWSLTEMILSGVFERHPQLKVASVENEGSWAPYFMSRLDWHYQNNMRLSDGHRFRDGALPSDFFRRNVYISFTEDPVLVGLRDFLGTDHLMWGSDFPHAEGTYPRSGSILGGQFDGVSDVDRVTMTQQTCANLFGFDVQKLAASA